VYKIHAAANAFSDHARTRDFILLKAAELARDEGFTHFLILDSNDWAKEGVISTPGSFTSTTTSNGYGSGGYGYGSTYTVGSYTPPSTTRTTKPRSDAVVKLLKNPPPEANAMDAGMVYRSLAVKYK
jgi:hypothetical protein